MASVDHCAVLPSLTREEETLVRGSHEVYKAGPYEAGPHEVRDVSHPRCSGREKLPAHL